MKKSRFGFLNLGIPLGIAFFCFRSCVPSYEESELKTIQGNLKSMNYNIASRFSGDALTLTLENSNNPFEIGEDNFYYFNQNLFKKTVKIGDTVSVIIPANFKENDDKIPIYEIRKGKTIYLKKADSLSIFGDTRKYLFWIAITASIIGLGRLIYWLSKKK